MKKIAVLILLVAFLAPLAHSQVIIALLVGDKLNSDKFELGIRLAGNWQNFMGYDGTNSRFSIGFGVYGTLKLSEGFSLQPEILFKDPRGASDLAGKTFGNANLDPLLQNASVTSKLAYVSLPVILKYSLTPQFSVGFGPQIGYLSSARNEYVAKVYSEEDLVFKDDVKSTLNTWDFALAFNLEYKFMKKRAIQVGLRYYLGLVDIYKENPGDSVRNSVFQIYLGIPIGGARKDK